MSYSNLRRGRVSLPGHMYLVTVVTVQRKPIFNDLHRGRCVINTIRDLDKRMLCETHAFVVMPDHVHWLFALGTTLTLSKLVQRFKGSSARRINSAQGTSASFWQPSFHDHAVRSEESLITLARYVVMNPVRAGLVQRIGDYPLWDAVWV